MEECATVITAEVPVRAAVHQQGYRGVGGDFTDTGGIVHIDVCDEHIISIETLWYPEFVKAVTELLPLSRGAFVLVVRFLASLGRVQIPGTLGVRTSAAPLSATDCSCRHPNPVRALRPGLHNGGVNFIDVSPACRNVRSRRRGVNRVSQFLKV